MSFGEESTRTDQTLPTTAFSDKSHYNSKKVKTKKNKMMGWIENGP